MPTYQQPVQPVDGKMKIVELFETVQGEGKFAGVPSTFIRTGMCNLECPGCDTVWDKWVETPIQEVADRILSFKSNHLVLTGGEPTLFQAKWLELLEVLDETNRIFHVTVETNGSVPLTAQFVDRIDHFSFSPKVGSLGFGEKFSHDVVRGNIRLTFWKNQIKYVLDPYNAEHCESVFAFHVTTEGYLEDEDVYFQPYDDETLVNIHHAPGLNNTQAYLNKLAVLTKLVLARSNSRFRVLPQLHKILVWR